MNIYLVTRLDDWYYEEYDAIVVAAETEYEALQINPATCEELPDYDYGWTSVDNLKAIKIGVADEGVQAGVVLASFRAG